LFCAVRFVTASRQLVKNLEQHTLNEHGLSKRYVRCLQVITGFYRCIVYFSMLPHKSCLDFSTLYHYICMCILWFPYIHIYIKHTPIVISPCQISEVVNQVCAVDLPKEFEKKCLHKPLGKNLNPSVICHCQVTMGVPLVRHIDGI